MEPLFTGLDETSLAYILLSRWAPGLVTVVAGGYLASILFPKLQRKSQRSAMVEEKKVEIAEQIVQQFNRYIAAWRRLIQLSTVEQARDLSDEERERKKEFLQDRKETRDTLTDHLKLCQLYFCRETCAEIQRFVDWDETQSSKRLDALPAIAAWQAHEDRIMRLLRDEMR